MSSTLRTTEISPRTAVFSIGALVLVTVGTIFGVKSFLSGPSSPPAAVTTTQSERGDEKISVTTDKTVTDLHDAKDPYGSITKRNLFEPVIKPQAPVLPPAPPIKQPVAPPVESPKPVPPVEPPRPALPPINTKNIAFTGVVVLPSGTYALLEELSTQRTEYVLVGGYAFGFRVVGLVDKSVTLEQNGQMATLALGDHKPDAPAGGAQPTASTPNNNNQATAKPADAAAPANNAGEGGDGSRRFRGRRTRSNDGSAVQGGSNANGGNVPPPNAIRIGGPFR